jgi:hypothetical protein
MRACICACARDSPLPEDLFTLLMGAHTGRPAQGIPCAPAPVKKASRPTPPPLASDRAAPRRTDRPPRPSRHTHPSMRIARALRARAPCTCVATVHARCAAHTRAQYWLRHLQHQGWSALLTAGWPCGKPPEPGPRPAACTTACRVAGKPQVSRHASSDVIHMHSLFSAPRTPAMPKHLSYGQALRPAIARVLASLHASVNTPASAPRCPPLRALLTHPLACLIAGPQSTMAASWATR